MYLLESNLIEDSVLFFLLKCLNILTKLLKNMSTRITITVREIEIGASNNGVREITILAGHGTNSTDDRLANNDV